MKRATPIKASWDPITILQSMLAVLSSFINRSGVRGATTYVLHHCSEWWRGGWGRGGGTCPNLLQRQPLGQDQHYDPRPSLTTSRRPAGSWSGDEPLILVRWETQQESDTGRDVEKRKKKERRWENEWGGLKKGRGVKQLSDQYRKDGHQKTLCLNTHPGNDVHHSSLL